MKDKYQKVAALSFTFSIVALALSLYASLNVFQGGGLSDEAFAKRVEAYAKQQNQPPPAQRVAEKVDNAIENNDAVLGSADAPISLVEFSDYECPFCGRFFTQTFGQLAQNYFEPGKVKLIYRDFPLNFHPNAKPAALAAECAREQGGDAMYFQYHDLIFKDQTKIKSEDLKAHASTLKLNAAKFNQCLDSGKFNPEVDEDYQAGQDAGVSGTPGFILLMAKNASKVSALKALEVIDPRSSEYVVQYIETQDGSRMGLRISGAHPYATFDQAIKVGL